MKLPRSRPVTTSTDGKRFAPQKISKIVVLPHDRPRSDPRALDAQSPEMVIGAGVVCRATVAGRGTLRIDGRWEGEICTEGTVFVGPQAVVKASIAAAAVVSRGQIVGAVRARESVHLLERAVLKGTVTTPTLTMDEGARLETHWSLWIHGEKIPGPRWAARYQRGPLTHPSWWR